MQLFIVLFTFGEHEMETEIYAGETGTMEEAREYLTYIHTNDDGDGYMQDVIEDPSMLIVESVSKFTTVSDKLGKEYKVGLI